MIEISFVNNGLAFTNSWFTVSLQYMITTNNENQLYIG